MRALLILAALLLAAPAHAVKIAVFTQQSDYASNGNAGFLANEIMASLETLNMAGQPYTEFNANARTWGETGVADSTWFTSEGYTDIIILREDGQADGAPVTGGPYGVNFRDSGSDFRVQDSPLGGLWSQAVYVFSPARLVPTTSYDPDIAGTNDRYIAGITHTTPAGSFAKPPTDSIGTWRYRLLARIRGSQTDTLYCDPQIFCCRPASWSGSGTVAALAWADSAINTEGGFSSCVEGDTAVAAWRYRPDSTKPGVTFFTFRMNYTSGHNLSILWALQNIYARSGTQAPTKILIDLMEHDAEAVDETNATSVANHAAFQTALNRARMARRVASPMNPAEFGNFYNAATLTAIRRGFSDNVPSVWMPFSYGIGADDWGLNFFAASDTAGVRVRFNQTMKTTSHADSGAFPRNRFNLSRLVSDAGVVGGWMSKVLVDAGVKVIESTQTADMGLNYVAPIDTGWALCAQSNSYGTSLAAVSVPGVGENRVIYVAPTFGFGHNATFTTLKGGVGDHEYVGATWINALGVATTRRTSLYWHTGGGVGVTNQDPFASWLWPLAARQLSYFDRVAAFNTTFANQIATPRRSFTARY